MFVKLVLNSLLYYKKIILMVNINDLRNSYERISNYLVKTPILTSDKLNDEFEVNIFLKNEVEQLTGSFKIRGSSLSIKLFKKSRHRRCSCIFLR